MKNVMIIAICLLLCASLFGQDGQYLTRTAQSDVSLQSAVQTPKGDQGLFILTDATGNVVSEYYGNKTTAQQQDVPAGTYQIQLIANKHSEIEFIIIQ